MGPERLLSKKVSEVSPVSFPISDGIEFLRLLLSHEIEVILVEEQVMPLLLQHLLGIIVVCPIFRQIKFAVKQS